MKNTIFTFLKVLLLIPLLITTNTHAQLPWTEDFEGSTCNQENDDCEVDYLISLAWTTGLLIDNDACLDGWRTSHGTPSVVGRPYEGNNSLSL